jgi:hypothetical protein
VYPADFALIAWLVAGTLVIKRLLSLNAQQHIGRSVVLLVAIPLAVAPMAILGCHLVRYSALSVVTAGVIFFWFSILTGRLTRAV